MRCKRRPDMKKNTTTKKSVKQAKGQKLQLGQLAAKQRLTVGIDLGDKSSRYCVLDEAGEVVSEDQVPTTKAGFDSLFAKMPASQLNRVGGGDAFAVGEPASGGNGARSDRGERAQGETDHP